MTLTELKEKVDDAILMAHEMEKNTDDIVISLQIDGENNCSVWSSDDVELHYDNDVSASGCVLVAFSDKVKNDASAFAS